MMADLTALGNDGIRRSFDEHYGTMMDVEQDPTGAMWAIHKQADRIEELEAKLAEVEAERDAFASNIPDAAQNLIRNAHTGRLKALHRAKALVEAGKAVVDRWDSPLWRDLRHMGESIDELRATISALEKNK